jgi:hypothetical protein
LDVPLNLPSATQPTIKDDLAERQINRLSHRQAQSSAPSIFVISRERAKLGYFWRHAYRVAQSGPFTGNVVNADTGKPVLSGEDQLRRSDFKKIKHCEVVLPELANSRRPLFSPLWQADHEKIHRMAPMEFIARYEPATFCTTSLCI